MTLRNILPTITLIVGIALGLMGARTFPSSGQTSNTSAHTKSNAQNSSRFRNPSHAQANKTSPSSNIFTGSAEDLLALLPANNTWIPTVRFLSTVERLPQEQVETLLEELQSASRSEGVRMAENTLIRRWAQLDPEGAFTATQSFDPKKIRFDLIATVTTEMASQNLERSISYADTLTNKLEKKLFLEGIAKAITEQDAERALKLFAQAIKEDSSTGTMSQSSSHYSNMTYLAWLKQDPNAAIAAVAGIEDPAKRFQNQKNFARALATRDPEKALSLALSLKGTERLELLDGVITNTARKDPQKALTFLKEIPDGPKRDDALNSLYNSWLKKDPEQAQAWMQALPKKEQAKVLRESINHLAKHDIEGALDLLDSFPPSADTPGHYSSLIDRWADSDPVAAQAWVEQLPPGPARESALDELVEHLTIKKPSQAASLLAGELINSGNSRDVSQIAEKWVLTDPDATLAWLGSLKASGTTRQTFIAETIYHLAEKEPAKAAAYTLDIEDPKVREGAIKSLVFGWGEQDLESAKTWIKAHLTKSEQASAHSSLIRKLSYKEPAKALALLEEASRGLAPEEIRTHFSRNMSAIATSWAGTDPAAAASWAQGQTDPKDRQTLIAKVVDKWARYDTTSAANFVLTLDEGGERDSAIKNLAKDLARWDPESAFLWADSAADEKARESIIRSTINTWKQSNPEAAREAVLGANITEEQRASILKGFKSN
ncbi:MAG: hypothetical protein ACSHYB_04685 [Roseibacillus sp.]